MYSQQARASSLEEGLRNRGREGVTVSEDEEDEGTRRRHRESRRRKEAIHAFLARLESRVMRAFLSFRRYGAVSRLAAGSGRWRAGTRDLATDGAASRLISQISFQCTAGKLDPDYNADAQQEIGSVPGTVARAAAGDKLKVASTFAGAPRSLAQPTSSQLACTLYGIAGATPCSRYLLRLAHAPGPPSLDLSLSLALSFSPLFALSLFHFFFPPLSLLSIGTKLHSAAIDHSQLLHARAPSLPPNKARKQKQQRKKIRLRSFFLLEPSAPYYHYYDCHYHPVLLAVSGKGPTLPTSIHSNRHQQKKRKENGPASIAALNTSKVIKPNTYTSLIRTSGIIHTAWCPLCAIARRLSHPSLSPSLCHTFSFHHHHHHHHHHLFLTSISTHLFRLDSASRACT
ncbi:hypothetical protein L249_4076 [Ophiocordyceps polyrhachis-furcata BCC 54312]|uniref:Uncharacterized protein n=1 Tax=Ophiocordyceps polyrhachis-furcata BCC 54312 TaxID=1330021 RepID=A0A367L5P0_9HYPO|nr:hypothetical protein L249_4076 [Ophiocordyceps polyrhachis-furcata BCC 54312]